MLPSNQWRLENADAARIAPIRREAQQILQASARAFDLDGAALILSELLANAIEHGGPPIDVFLCLEGDPAYIVVEDSGAGFATQIRRADVFAERGRGLVIVEQLAGPVVVERKERTRVASAIPKTAR